MYFLGGKHIYMKYNKTLIIIQFRTNLTASPSHPFFCSIPFHSNSFIMIRHYSIRFRPRINIGVSAIRYTPQLNFPAQIALLINLNSWCKSPEKMKVMFGECLVLSLYGTDKFNVFYIIFNVLPVKRCKYDILSAIEYFESADNSIILNLLLLFNGAEYYKMFNWLNIRSHNHLMWYWYPSHAHSHTVQTPTYLLHSIMCKCMGDSQSEL